MAFSNAQLVTVPVMDLRFAEVSARFEALEARMDARFEAVDARIDARFASLQTEIAASRSSVKSEMALLEARVDAKLQKMKLYLVVVIIAVAASNPHIPKIAALVAETIRALPR